METPEARSVRLARERVWKQKYRDNNRDKIVLRQKAKRYGITVEEVNTILLRGCEICGTFSKLCIDHNHETGKVRGCLCIGCNTFLGHITKSPNKLTKALEYLNVRN